MARLMHTQGTGQTEAAKFTQWTASPCSYGSGLSPLAVTGDRNIRVFLTEIGL